MRAVLERDFLAEVSRPRAFWLRAGAAAAVSGVLLLVLVENRALLRDAPDQVAHALFLGGAFSLLGLLALLTPVGVVGSILEERERETLAVVLSTPGRPLAFAAAKLVSRGAAVLVWALAAVVPLTVLALLGGVAGGDLADLLLLATAIVLELASWGIWISSVTRRLATAAVLAYLLPALRAVLVLLGAGELAFVLSISVGEYGWFSDRDSGLFLSSLHACLLGLVAAIAGASSMAHERSTGTLDLLRVSSLTPREILRGKVVGAVRGLGLLALLPLVHGGILGATGMVRPTAAVLVPAVLLVSVSFWLGVGILSGILQFRPGRAVALAAGIFGGFLAGIPLLMGIVRMLAGNGVLLRLLVGLWPPTTFSLVLLDAERGWTYDTGNAARLGFPLLAVAAVALHLSSHRLLAWRLRREGEGG